MVFNYKTTMCVWIDEGFSTMRYQIVPESLVKGFLLVDVLLEKNMLFYKNVFLEVFSGL